MAIAMPHRLQDVDLRLVDSLVVPASLHDVAGRFVHMNAAAERASGLSKADLLGRHFTDPVPPKHARTSRNNSVGPWSAASRPTSRPCSSMRAARCEGC